MSESREARGNILREWLVRQGYSIVARADGWVECLVSLADERWLGRGTDELDALGDALRQMVPSRAARALLPEAVLAAMDVALGSSPPTRPEPPSAEAAVAVPDAVDESPAAVEPNGSAFEAPAGTADRSEPTDDELPPAVVEVAPPSAEREPESPVEQLELVVPAPQTQPSLVPVVLPSLSAAEALAEIEPLVDRIAAERLELGLASPERQRLVIASWICRARAIEEANRGRAVVTKVAGIAHDLTALCKIWWPGSVLALQLSATPRTTIRDLALPLGEAPAKTWADAAEVVERAYERVVEAQAADGRDEYGWADSTALRPAPTDPEAELGQVRAAIEELTGPVANPPPKAVPPAIRLPAPADLERFFRWGRTARWLRGAVVDFETWSQIIGRLRWMAERLPQPARDGLAAALDPAQKPVSTWAALLGRDPEEKRRRAERRALHARLAELETAPDAGAVGAWLLDAFALIDNEELGRLVQPMREVVVGLVPEEMARTRGERRRLRKLQELLAEPAAARSEGETEAGEQDDDSPAAIVPGADLFSLVRPRTAGRRIIFVSNRNDPSLQALLTESFGFADVDWCEGTPRRIESLPERIANGSVDFVLAATGFQSHWVDTKLYGACKRAGIPYLRVNKGRPLACAVALARELHLPPPGKASPDVVARLP